MPHRRILLNNSPSSSSYYSPSSPNSSQSSRSSRSSSLPRSPYLPCSPYSTSELETSDPSSPSSSSCCSERELPAENLRNEALDAFVYWIKKLWCFGPSKPKMPFENKNIY